MLSVLLSDVLKQMNLKMPSDEGVLNFELTGFASFGRAMPGQKRDLPGMRAV